MKETEQLKKLMETVDTAFADKTKISEDWGSSDDYALLQSMEKYLDKHGLNPDTIRKAAENEADFYYEIMGYETPEDAVDSIIYSWVHKTERGQQLQQMLAPVEEGKKLDRFARKIVPGLGKHEAGERAKDYGLSSMLDKQYADNHNDEPAARDSRIARKASNKYRKIAGNESVNEAEFREYDIEFDLEDVTIFTHGGKPVLEMPLDDFIALISKFNRMMTAAKKG